MSLAKQSGGSVGSKLATPPPKPADPANREAHISFKTFLGTQLRGTLIRMTRHAATFELFSPKSVLNVSEILKEFRIDFHGQTMYFGTASIYSLIDSVDKVTVQVSLETDFWVMTDAQRLVNLDGHLLGDFKEFRREWQKSYLVTADFKVVVADMQIFLHDLRHWLDKVEVNLRSLPPAQAKALEKNFIADLAQPVIQALDGFIDRFETIVSVLPPDSQPAYRSYLRRQWHALLLAAPFGHRAFYKPLGYAGDYQMVDMMIRPPEEGDSLFARIINIWFLGQTPAEAHRNRVGYLERKLVAEAARVRRSERHPLRVFNLGCGPACEIQRFASASHLSLATNFSLVDFNQETLDFLQSKLAPLVAKNPAIQFKTFRKSVTHMLREGARIDADTPKFDYVYCAGLFDYLSDSVCRSLMEIFYDMLEPGGLLVATNASDAVNSLRPFRYSMEYILDWFLIYRNREQFLAVVPSQAGEDEVSVVADATGANLFLEIRKSKNV